ncbi:lectin [Streptomyces sp. SGAir0957]
MRRTPHPSVSLGTGLLAATALAASFLVAPGAAAAPSAPALVAAPATLVNPFIGTSNQANDFPGADVPFGMVQWSPDTPSRPPGGGYEYNDKSITGFSLTHIAGPGCGAAGDVPVLPTVGAVSTSATDSFSHANESASAGSYKVALDNKVTTELTATRRSGMARFSFPSTTQANLVFKLTGSQNGASNTQFNVVSSTEVSGQVTSGRFCGAGNTYTVYFDMVFDQPFKTSGASAAASTLREPAGQGAAQSAVEKPNKPVLHGEPATASDAGTRVGEKAQAAPAQNGYVTFDATAHPTVQAKVGISYVSVANATANRTAENTGWDFDATRSAAQNAWNSELGKIQIGGGSAAHQQMFYTALYHSLLHPNIVSDTNGQYAGFDGRTHTVDSGHQAVYGNYSGWDIYRSQAQLEALVDPQVASDTAQSMLDDYRQTGIFPKWSEYNGESYVMVGDPAAAIIADYYAFGARRFDAAETLKGLVAQASKTNNDRPGLTYLNSPGWMPHDGSYGCCNFYGPVATTLEYNTADFALSALAGALGDTASQNTYAARAQNWRHVLNPASGFVEPRNADGAWTGGFDPTSGTDMVEGDSWIYTGMIPFNVAGLAKAKGGNTAMNHYLDTVLRSFTGANGYAWVGNEPSIELPWEYDYTGAPYKTQSTVRAIQNQIWSTAPSGLANGNDDLGAMSAWYVWSALGMFPQTPGTADLALGSPVFPQAVVTLPSGKTLTINGNGAADDAPYVQSASWNGASWNNAYAPAAAVTSGGTLTYNLGATANTGWASGSSAAPPSYSGGVAAPATPRIGPLASAVAGTNGKLCVDVANSGTGDGTQLQTWGCNQTYAQDVTVAADSTLRVLGKCVDVSNSGTADGTLVQLYRCNGTGAQQWKPSGNGSLLNPNSGKCLDIPNSAPSGGTQLQIYTCNGTGAQNWTLPATTTTAGTMTTATGAAGSGNR